MKKICFIVQDDFLTNHFGVRNYFMTIYNVLSENNQVDFVIHRKNQGSIEWKIVDLEYPREKTKDYAIEWSVEKNSNYLRYSDFENFKNSKVKEFIPKMYYRGIGQNLEESNYDIAVITNPWLVDFEEKIHAKRIIGIVYDLIANEFSLTKPTFDFTWANKHHKGYEYFLKNCDEIMAIAKAPAIIFNKAYKSDKCNYFAPFVPYVYSSVEYKNHKKENAMILAAPFDPRKGIENMPDLINSVADKIETLYIFGMPRCPQEMFDNFFKKLEVERIVYYPYISTDGLIDLYGKTKVLLFPSLKEGLGFPIIESQVCGCRVLTTNDEPMNTLILDGCYTLKDTLNENKEILLDILNDDSFDFKKLSLDALKKFDYKQIRYFFEVD